MLAARPVAGAAITDADERDLTLLGLGGLLDPPRPGVAGAVATAREAGIKVIMTTGDHPRTALAIAQEIGGGARPVVVTGERLRAMLDAHLRHLLQASEVVFARLAAEQKLRIVRALRSLDHEAWTWLPVALLMLLADELRKLGA